MKLSFYNIVIPYYKSKYLLYNTANNAFAIVDKSYYNENNKDLINGGFVVEENCDELLLYTYRYLSGLYRNSNLNLTIATTMNCNFACPYCFEAGHRHSDNMNDNVIEAINNYLFAKKERPISITWFGGEPFLNWHAIDKISSFLVKNNIQYKANAITNGSLLNSFMIKEFDKYQIKYLQITLDGTKEVHDKKRFYRNRKGSFDRIIDNVYNVLDLSHCNIVIRVNLDKTNIYNYHLLKKEIHNRFESYFSNGCLSLWPNYIRNRTSFDGCNNCLTPVEFYEYSSVEEDYRPKYPTITGCCQFRSMSCFCIAPDGAIYKCLEHVGDNLHSVGNIVDGKIDLYRQADFALSALPFDNEECRGCKILPICGGGCSIDARKNALEDQNINLCPVEKERLNDILIQYYEKYYA